jgi:hypothetical protein
MHAKGLNICLKGMTRKWLGLLGIACYQAAGWLAGAEPLLAVFRAAQAMDEAIPDPIFSTFLALILMTESLGPTPTASSEAHKSR